MKTEQKQLVNELNENNSTFRLLFEGSPDAMLLLNGDVFIDCNPAAIKMFACSDKKQLLRIHPSDLSPEKQFDGSLSRDEEKKLIAKTIEQGSNQFEWLHRRINGDVFPAEVLLTNIPVGENKIVHVTLKDISERKKVQNALKESEDKYRTIVETTGTATLIIEEDTMISLANMEFTRLCSYSKEEIEGKKTWAEFFVKEDLEKMLSYHRQRRIDPNAAPRNYDARLVDRKGNIRDVYITVAMIPETKKSVASFLDITDRKRAEEELKMAHSELERLKNRLEKENLYLQNEIKLTHNFEEIIGKSKALKNILGKVEQVATTDSTVLILGETGTGKELIARAIHNISRRNDHTLVKVNCAALPVNIIESELFGHEKGAFTGAYARKIGRFELANMGTIFLDEIGDLPLDLQVKLLRVLQNGEFERIGNSNTIKANIRIIAATNRDLVKAIENGTFREDLYYRLNVFPIKVPSLRERKEDIPYLANYFIKKFCKKIGRQIEIIPQKVMDELMSYDWPGNIRELENIIERAVIVCDGKRLEAGDWLPRKFMSPCTSELTTLEAIEKSHILKVLNNTHWQVSGEKGAAKILGLNQNTLVSKMKKLNIHR